MVGMGKVRHLIAKTGKTYCGRTITANGQGDDCKSCARIESTDSRAWESFGPDNVKAMAEAMPLLEQISETAGRAERAKVETVEPCFHCGRADSPRRDDIVIPFPHECVGRAGLEREGLLPPSIPTRPVTVAPVGTPCGWTAYGETGTRLTCHGGRDAVHILTKTLPVAVEGTALCGFHSPYDVTDAERAARHAAYLNAELAAAAGDECVCWIIFELGAGNLPDGGMACQGCGSVFTREGGEPSDDVKAMSNAVIRRNGAKSEASWQAACSPVAEEVPFTVTKEDILTRPGKPIDSLLNSGVQEQSGMDVLANLLSLDGGRTPARVIRVESDPDKCPMHGGYNIPGVSECAGCTWAALVAGHQGSIAGKRAISVAHSYAGRTHREGSAEYFYAAIDSLTDGMAKAETGCRSLKHVYCVGPCPERDRNEANASAARTHVETEGECLARIKREDFRVGDAYTFRSMVGYRLYQDRPFTCRGLECQCGNACHGTMVESPEILTDVAHYVSGGLEIQGDKGSRAVIRPDRLD